MDKKKIRDDSLLEAVGGKWTIDTLTEEEKDEYYRVKEALEKDGDYVGYNDFVRRMNEKYGRY